MQKFEDLKIDFSKPTFIFCECVLAYIDKDKIEQLLKFFSETFENLIFVDYEMFNSEDGFGRMMVQNFKARGIPLYGIDFFTSFEEIRKRYKEQGFEALEIYDMNKVSSLCLDPEEYSRVMKLEFLDEYEEYWLMQGHYFFSAAKKFKLENGARSSIIEQFSLKL